MTSAALQLVLLFSCCNFTSLKTKLHRNLVLYRPTFFGKIHLLLAEFLSSVTLPVISAPWHIVGAADLTGNGYGDLVWENTLNGQRVIWLVVDGVYSSSITLPTVSHSVEHRRLLVR
jgi:hypothetical protein